MALSLSSIREQRLVELSRRTGCEIRQHNGQRTYGPPPSWIGPPPRKGSEVFVGKLPRDVFEDELVPLFQSAGHIYEIRLMMDFSGSNRGFAFVTYACPEEADKAIRDLDNFEIRKNRRIGVCKSVDNCRLFVGGIPKDKTKTEIYNEFSRLTDGVVNVILYNNVLDKSKNRGFAFVEYDTHRSAAMARRKLLPGRILLWGHELAVDWAEPEPQVKTEIMNRVTVLFVRNLTLSTTEEVLRDIFSFHGSLRVDKVKKIRDYAFVHYFTREEAEVALKTLNGKVIDNCVIEVHWSKPPECSSRQQSQLLVDGYRSYPRHYLTAVDSLHQSPLWSMRVCQDFSQESTGLSSSRDENLSPLVKPKRSVGVIGDQAPQARERFLRSAIFNKSNISFNRDGARPQHCCKYPLILSRFCSESSWGEPDYNVFTLSEEVIDQSNLFACKVSITDKYGRLCHFVCPNFAKTVEEAKCNAAYYVLGNMGFNDENLAEYFSAFNLPPVHYIHKALDSDFGQGDGAGRTLPKQALQVTKTSAISKHDENKYDQGPSLFGSLASCAGKYTSMNHSMDMIPKLEQPGDDSSTSVWSKIRVPGRDESENECFSFFLNEGSPAKNFNKA